MKLRDLKAGDSVFADGGFTCLRGGFHFVEADGDGLFIQCDDGKHYLVGQENENGELVGLYPGLDPRTTIELMADRDGA